MGTKLKGEVKGIVGLFKDFKSEALLPLFEAVVNGIQAVEERYNGNANMGKISVKINRSMQGDLPLEDRKEPDIESFEISDDGIGFTDKNFESFETIATIHKVEKGCKGIGRFTWLKAFDRVEIESVYTDGEEHYKRRILFSIESEIEAKPVEKTNAPVGTTVKLLGFKDKYRKSPSACKTGNKIAQRIMEHCLFYFVSAMNPKMSVIDNRPDGDQHYNLQDFYDEIKNNMTPDSLNIAGKNFTLYHLKLYGTSAAMHNLVLCANNRDVVTIGMSKLLGTTSQFDENDKRFTYAVYVSGQYLDSHVDASRTSFDIPEDSAPLDKDAPIGQQELEKAIAEKSKAFLGDYLEKIEIRRQEVAQKYVSEQNPALRSVLHYCPDAVKELEPNSSDEKIDETLYRYKGKAEYAIRQKSQKLLQTQSESVNEIKNELESLQAQLDDIQKDNLTGYIVFRKLIIELLDKKISMSAGGKFEREDIIHDIFFPRKAVTNEINYEDHNLWLLDDRLTFHHFSASDLPLSKNMQTSSDDRPDVVAFSEIDDDSRVAKSVSIIEFKRPQRKTYDESPIDQMLRMLDEIKAGKIVQQATGRPLEVSETTRFYCYGICDFSDKVKKFATNADYVKLNGELGYFYYHKTLGASIYLIDFDKIVTDAKKRHHAFFEKLGIK